MEQAASNGRVYLKKTEPGTHLIQVTSQGIYEKVKRYLKRKRKTASS